MNLTPGSFVTHAKLPELGAGEIMSAHDGSVLIRFTTGARTFKVKLVVPHLVVTFAAPAPTPAPKKAKRARKEPAAKAAAAAAAKA